MTTILFMVCFTLLAIAFFLIILLFLKISHLKDIEKKQEALLKEFESVITSYVMEIKEENEVFLERIKDLEHHRKNSKDGVNQIPERKLENGEGKGSFQLQEPEISPEEFNNILPSFTNEETSNYSLLKEDIYIAQKEQIKLDPLAKDELYVQSIVAQAQLLQKQGLTLDEIAKKLNKGKTEVELFLKFRQNN